jgi:hypothetical protein
MSSSSSSSSLPSASAASADPEKGYEAEGPQQEGTLVLASGEAQGTKEKHHYKKQNHKKNHHHHKKNKSLRRDPSGELAESYYPSAYDDDYYVSSGKDFIKRAMEPMEQGVETPVGIEVETRKTFDTTTPDKEKKPPPPTNDDDPLASVKDVFSFAQTTRVKTYVALGMMSAVVSGCVFPAMAWVFSASFTSLTASIEGDDFLRSVRKIAFTLMGLGYVPRLNTLLCGSAFLFFSFVLYCIEHLSCWNSSFVFSFLFLPPMRA